MKRSLALIAVMAVLGVVLAAEVAHAGRADTTLTMKIDDTIVKPRETIHVRGRLDSPYNGCKRGKTIELYIDGRLYSTTTTDDEGRYHFAVPGPHPRGKHEFKTVFRGTDNCARDASPTRTVTVRRRNTG